MQPVSNDPIRRMQVSRLAHPTAVACLIGQDATGTLSEPNFFFFAAYTILLNISRRYIRIMPD